MQREGRRKPIPHDGSTNNFPASSREACHAPISTARAGRAFCFMTTKKSSYSDKLRDPRWQKKRLCVMQRDGFACRDCGDAKSTLQVHHCHYEKGEPWQTDERFLLTLCEDCHEKRGDLESDGKRALGFIFSKLSNAPDDESLRDLILSMMQYTQPGEGEEGGIRMVSDRDGAMILALDRITQENTK